MKERKSFISLKTITFKYFSVFNIIFIIIGISVIITMNYYSSNFNKWIFNGAIIFSSISYFSVLLVNITFIFNFNTDNNHFKAIETTFFWIPIVGSVVLLVILNKKNKLDLKNENFEKINFESMDLDIKIKKVSRSLRRFLIFDYLLMLLCILFLYILSFIVVGNSQYFWSIDILEAKIVFICYFIAASIISIINKISFVNFFFIKTEKQGLDKVLKIIALSTIIVPILNNIVWTILALIKALSFKEELFDKTDFEYKSSLFWIILDILIFSS